MPADTAWQGGEVVLENVRQGDTIVVRTNYYPAWSARVDSQQLELFSRDGQMAFIAPQDGSYIVTLEYPRRRWLSALAILTLLTGMVLEVPLEVGNSVVESNNFNDGTTIAAGATMVCTYSHDFGDTKPVGDFTMAPYFWMASVASAQSAYAPQ